MKLPKNTHCNYSRNKTKLKILTQKKSSTCLFLCEFQLKKRKKKLIVESVREMELLSLDCYRTLAESVELVELEIIKRKKAHFTQGIEMLR